jgi:aminomuconate-semialdehyde/2-hydroxymuconate-6-semialdehyde dehydrogenase
VERLLHFIGGVFVEPGSGAWLENVEPATGKVIAHIAGGTKADVDSAVKAARQAFPSWSEMPPSERSRLLNRWADLVERDLESLARAESVDTGKPLALARDVDIPRAAANLRFFAGAILHTSSEAYETNQGAGRRGLNYTLRRARGVAGCISPWNLPLYLFTWKIAPALATGNTVVGKASEVTPTTATRLAELSAEAGLPEGVFNLVHGTGGEAGAAIVEHPDVPTITFTGGTATGRSIARSAGPMFKRLSLELGGKNPTLVFADAGLDHAIETAARAAFTNQGQICLCGSRIYVERRVYDSFVDGLAARARTLRVGDPLEESTRFGALVSAAHLEKVKGAVERARAEGGEVLCGGRIAEAPNQRCAGGFFYEPTLITGLPRGCETQREEIFGPVVSVTPVEDEAEMIELANDVDYGLAAMIFTNDLTRAHRVAARVEAGIIWINCWMLRDLRTPFGGMKSSGVGREGGEAALRFFTEETSVTIDLAPAPGS